MAIDQTKTLMEAMQRVSMDGPVVALWREGCSSLCSSSESVGHEQKEKESVNTRNTWTTRAIIEFTRSLRTDLY